ncbi:hypothetical protein NOM68_18490, partial [Proteus mirabilis]|uniref:hypothetical protein n=1 Tax=Proteus mirabilis TaxID=584 RepID=UPI00359C767F|nr:hypothetical protein [Proteus mirabilis]
TITNQHPLAIVMLSDSDGIGGKGLLIDSYAQDGLGVKAAKGKFKQQDIVIRNFTKEFVEGDATPNIVVVEERLTVDDFSYDLNNEVPKLYIKGNEVSVVSMTKHYVTHTDVPGTNTTTFVYITRDSSEQKILSINNLGEVFEQ